MDKFNRQLKQLKEEDFIWIIYYFIITFALIANYYERNYIYTNNINSKNKANKISSTILIIAFFIYLYFTIISYDNLKYLINNNGNNRDIRISYERFITNSLFLIAGIFAIYVDNDSNNIDIGII